MKILTLIAALLAGQYFKYFVLAWVVFKLDHAEITTNPREFFQNINTILSPFGEDWSSAAKTFVKELE
jgi:hypothetical protein